MPRYGISYRREAVADLAFYGRRIEALVRAAVDRLLTDEPVPVPGREGLRRALDPNPLDAQFRLRVDQYRVYYIVDEDASEVDVIRVGYKPGETVSFRGVPTQMRD
jgi:mRNA-degrading endonuclease RelE of RelBE toxin-antitoxin system